MGHVVAKSYRTLREKLDRFAVGAPGRTTIYEILKTIFSEEEAALAAQVPFRLASVRSLSRRTGFAEDTLRKRLEAMADRGLLFDLRIGGEMRYMLNPTMVGFFEFTMMRVRDDLDQAKLGRLLHRYVIEEPDFFGQFKEGTQTTPFRTLVHEDTVPENYTEVLDWERASYVVDSAQRWGLALCHCRHVRHHTGSDCEKLPMEVCLSLGFGADYLIRHGLSKPIERAEARALLERTREAGVVHLCDNVQRNPTFLCNCCGCCCEVLVGFKRFDFLPNTFSSNFQAEVDAATCNGCKKCLKRCPVNAIDMASQPRQVKGKRVERRACPDPDVCLGCGVCVSACQTGALRLAPRAQRRITPEGTFTRVLSAALEQGKLHEMLVDKDDGFGPHAANALLGAVLKLPPARQLLARAELKSRFVGFLLAAASKGGMKGTDL